MAALPLRNHTEEPSRRRSIRAEAVARTRPVLAVVQRQKRWPALLAAAAWSVVVAGLLATAVFHTQLAERQLRLDRLDRQLAVERERFEDLRYQRAELRSPVRLSAAASELGMSRGTVTSFVSITPQALARQLAAAGVFGSDTVEVVVRPDPLDQVRAVKSVSRSQP